MKFKQNFRFGHRKRKVTDSDHDYDGTFIVYRHNIEASHLKQKIKTWDVLPTISIIHFKIPHPRYVDGNVIKTIIKILKDLNRADIFKTLGVDNVCREVN